MIVRWPVVAARGLAVGGQAPGVRGESYGERAVRPTVEKAHRLPRRFVIVTAVRTDKTEEA